MRAVRRAIGILNLGPRWVFFRVRYEARKRVGLLARSSPLRTWDQIALPSGELSLSHWFYLPAAYEEDASLYEAEDVLKGNFVFFQHRTVAAGIPPRWSRNPLTDEAAAEGIHWSRLAAFAHGDIKVIWELSRFGWAYTLARAYARREDRRYAAGFWTLFESWLESYPPNAGAGWMCGQEAAFRLMATTFAVAVLSDSAESTPNRLDRFRKFVRATGQRIGANLQYALSQANNHGVSECVGLITAALVLPETPEAESWLRLGLGALETQLGELVYSDGGFSQHSSNYHRVLLDDLMWCETIFRRTQCATPSWLLQAARRSLDFLNRIVDPASGRVPLYGPNDGARVLPLADSAFLDFRPTLQAGFALFYGVRRLPAGPWDEAAYWLCGNAAWSGVGRESTWEETAKYHAPESGMLIWENSGTRLFMRCPRRMRHRPTQADMLHVDVFRRGVPITVDPGTFSYHDRGRFRGALGEASVHNTMTFDGAEPMERISRFLYFPWPTGKAGWTDSTQRTFQAEHGLWRRLGIRHLRRVSASGMEFRVCDLIEGRGTHVFRLHWLLEDWPYEWDRLGQRILLALPDQRFEIRWKAPASASVSLVRGDPETQRGWQAPHYFEAMPALSLAIEGRFEGQMELETCFLPLPPA